jgi:Transposase DDE domain
MDLDIILNGFKQSFDQIPETDGRAKIGPRQFVICLIFGLCTMDRGKRTLASLRRAIMKATGEKISRGGFWERLATGRLLNFVLLLVESAIQQMGAMVLPCGKLQALITMLNVKGILVLDSTSITLPGMAGAIFPGPRKNVAPAVIKWHNCFDLFGGAIKWFDLSPGTSHDHNHFPDLQTIVGYLIIFDLGYFDFCLLQALDNVGGYFLSRIKSNVVIQIEQVVRGLPRSYVGKRLFSARLPKGKNVIEIVGSFGGGLFHFRVIGFWNPIDKTYHWYVTNLTVSAKLIYPLYRLRWAVELFFKMAKSSWRLSDITSADPNIAQTLVLASIAVTLLSQPLAFTLSMLRHQDEEQLQLPSLQRAGIIVAHASAELRDFLLTKGSGAAARLKCLLNLFTDELFDPNRNRDSTMQRVFREAGLMV